MRRRWFTEWELGWLLLGFAFATALMAILSEVGGW